MKMPAAWTLEPPWQVALPRDGEPKGPWWQHFQDPTLDALQRRALAQNATLAAAQSRWKQARALVAVAEAGQWPGLSLGVRTVRQRISANRPLTSYSGTNFATVQNDYIPALSASYEVDFAGRVAETLRSAQASAEQVKADLANTQLLMSADLATAYINMRALDSELQVIARSIELQRKALDFVQARRTLGATSGLEVAQQQALLDNTLTQVDVLRRQRAQFEHAIATLVGEPAPSFALPTSPLSMTLPKIPLGLPSQLLERRPDVASAERAMAVANAQVGLARASFYPSVLLTSSAGFDSRLVDRLFDLPSLVWSVGMSATQVLFDAGRIKANEQAARAGHETTAANYRRVVLTALQEAEDGITGVAALQRASAQALTAQASARRVLELATGRYEGGISTYLDVINAQQALLASERQVAQLQGQTLVACVFLVRALGGDW
jgi:NodT family efflux transporter outer membrane factor (OMF) lipoprotein